MRSSMHPVATKLYRVNYCAISALPIRCLHLPRADRPPAGVHAPPQTLTPVIVNLANLPLQRPTPTDRYPLFYLPKIVVLSP